MPTYDLGLEHVSLAFATKTIFTDVTQGVFEGDRIGIVGRNGDGKSTLLHLFRGAQEPDSGRVTKRGGLTFGMLDQRDPAAGQAWRYIGESCRLMTLDWNTFRSLSLPKPSSLM